MVPNSYSPVKQALPCACDLNPSMGFFVGRDCDVFKMARQSRGRRGACFYAATHFYAAGIFPGHCIVLYPCLKIRPCEELMIEESVQFLLISPVLLSFQGS